MAAKKAARHNQETILFLLMGLIIIGLIVSGYFLFVKKILPELASKNQGGITNPALAVSDTNSEKKESYAFIPDDDAQVLTLYFPVKGKDNFQAQARKVRRKKMLTAQARQIVEEILRGPDGSELYTAIPANTKLKGLFFDSGTFVVDLSREFSAITSTGATEQVLGIYSIVNSLTEIDPKAKVRFLINGSEQSGENGHLDLTQSLTRLQEIIVE